MNTNVLAVAAALSDQDLLARLDMLAGREREASAELVAHLAALDCRPAVYAAQGYGSLFRYCTEALRLSEDAACNRIEAARACRRFPVIVELLASGSMTLTSVRLLARHLTAENYQAVLARAQGRSRQEIEVLVAELAPRPDIPASVRRLPNPGATPPSAAPAVEVATGVTAAVDASMAPSPEALVPPRRPVVQASAPQRFQVRFTIGQGTHDKLRRVQALLRREIPDGDPGAIFDRAVTLLLEKVEKTKLAATAAPRRIRPGTDRKNSRHIPSEVKRAVWQRDGGRCAFVSSTGRMCIERTFLEFHHLQAYAKQGPATAENISLRCRRHNQYDAELIFGPHGASVVRESPSALRPHPTDKPTDAEYRQRRVVEYAGREGIELTCEWP